MNSLRAFLRICLATAACMPVISHAGPEATRADSSTTALPVLTVRSEPDSALVLLDGKRMGIAPLTLDTLAEGTHVLKIVDPDVSSWLTGSVSDTIRLRRGDRLVRTYVIPRQLSLLSNPPGARVFLLDSLLGETPLLMARDPTIGGSVLTVHKDGYRDAVVRTGDAGRGFLLLPLSPVWSGSGNDKDLIEESVAAERSRTGAYLSGAAAVLTGIATAYLKIKADDRQNQYQLTGNHSLLAERTRLDRGAAVTFALTQISFGIFAYFLLSD